MTRGPPRASPSASAHSAGGLNRAVEERAVIKLEGQVELILFPRGTSSQHLDWRRVPICFGSIGLFWRCSLPPSFPSLPSSLSVFLWRFLSAHAGPLVLPGPDNFSCCLEVRAQTAVRRRQNKASPTEIGLIELNYFMRWHSLTRNDLL